MDGNTSRPRRIRPDEQRPRRYTKLAAAAIVDWDLIPAPLYDRMEKIGATFEWLMNSCDAPFTAYAAVAPRAAGKAVIQLLSFGLDDVLRGLIRPSGLGKHRPLGRAARILNRAFPEIGEAIGKFAGDRLQWVQALRAAGEGQVASRLWQLDGLAQQALFYFLLFDVVNDLGTAIIKGVKKQGFCDSSIYKRALGLDGPLRLTAEGEQTNLPPVPRYFHGLDYDNRIFTVPGFPLKTAYCRITGKCQIVNLSEDQEIFLRLDVKVHNLLGEPVKEAIQATTIGPGEAGVVVASVAGRGHSWSAVPILDIYPPRPVDPSLPYVGVGAFTNIWCQEIGLKTLA